MVSYRPMSKRLLGILLLGWLGFGCGGDDDGGGAPDAPAGGGDPPVISRISWTPAAGCTAGTASDFTVMVEVLDPDTPPSMLTFSGQVASCTGAIDAATVTINCPNAAPYGGSVTVSDADGNSDTASGWTVRPCEAGSFMPM